MMKLLMKQFYQFKLYHSTLLTLFEKLLAWKVRLVNILSLSVWWRKSIGKRFYNLTLFSDSNYVREMAFCSW